MYATGILSPICRGSGEFEGKTLTVSDLTFADADGGDVWLVVCAVTIIFLSMQCSDTQNALMQLN